MSSSYDPDKAAEFNAELFHSAKEENKHVIHVICDHDEDGEYAGVQFLAATGFIPRVGDKIWLQDGNIVKVIDVAFKVAMMPEGANLMANVVCRIHRSKKPPE